MRLSPKGQTWLGSVMSINTTHLHPGPPHCPGVEAGIVGASVVELGQQNLEQLWWTTWSRWASWTFLSFLTLVAWVANISFAAWWAWKSYITFGASLTNVPFSSFLTSWPLWSWKSKVAFWSSLSLFSFPSILPRWALGTRWTLRIIYPFLALVAWVANISLHSFTAWFSSLAHVS